MAQHFPGIEVYGEEIKQGFEEPCFFVKLFPVAQDREFNRRYKRYHSFDIHYFAQTNEEMHAVAEQLYGCLEYIQVSDRVVRGNKQRHEILDGVLHFLVSYDFFVFREATPDPKMQELEQEGLIK